jgi:hydrogenase maturation protein HypF
VGFRPFLYRLAADLGLAGWVNNSSQGVSAEAEGDRAALEIFLRRIQSEKPPRSVIQSLEVEWLPPAGHTSFTIRKSDPAGGKTTLVLPEIATCHDCQREIFDPSDRRHFYPFTNCTNCGPRFTIIEQLPYDRRNTSMKSFQMCPQCQAEYDDPLNRRFHAQPNACHACGPHVEVWDRRGILLHSHRQALESAAASLARGEILAVKGLGGFHLMAAAHLDQAIHTLRERKSRQEKPLALMFASLEQVKLHCEVDQLESQMLLSPAAPIALLRRRKGVNRQIALSDAVAPANPWLGAMLACSPLHHLLLQLCGFPVVATSGNLAEEPICTDEHEALERLGKIADLFLVHNRPIVRHADDSIVRVIAGREMVLRRARGYAPLPVVLRSGHLDPAPSTVLAVGAHLKNSIAISVGSQVFISQHIGDLETVKACAAFERVIADFQSFYEASPVLIAADAHPDYLSTRFARKTGLPVASIQHHYAHALSCMAEHGLDGDVLGVCWDGTGWGPDGTIWGGEFLSMTTNGFERLARIRTFRLPGGEMAVREPRRSALGLLYEIFAESAFEMTDLAPIRAFAQRESGPMKQMLKRGVNTPRTSSVGRLFDVVASLAGLRQRAAFEGQAAMDLEFALDDSPAQEAYPLRLRTVENGGELAAPSSPQPQKSPSPLMELDWAPMILALLDDLRNKLPAGVISTKFHNGLAEAVLTVARHSGCHKVLISGGCFQNKYLSERIILRLRQEGFSPFWHEQVPPNDGGIALGQVAGVFRLRETGD